MKTRCVFITRIYFLLGIHAPEAVKELYLFLLVPTLRVGTLA